MVDTSATYKHDDVLLTPNFTRGAPQGSTIAYLHIRQRTPAQLYHWGEDIKKQNEHRLKHVETTKTCQN